MKELRQALRVGGKLTRAPSDVFRGCMKERLAGT